MEDGEEVYELYEQESQYQILKGKCLMNYGIINMRFKNYMQAESKYKNAEQYYLEALDD